MKLHPRLQRGGCMWCPDNSNSTEIRLQGNVRMQTISALLYTGRSRCHCGHGEIWHSNHTPFRENLEKICMQHIQSICIYTISSSPAKISRRYNLYRQERDAYLLRETVVALKRRIRDVNEAEDTSPSCVICMLHSRNTVLLPCRHAQFCKECSNRLMQKRTPRCPLCRGKIECILDIIL